MNATEALDLCVRLKPRTLLDVGSGSGAHADAFRAKGVAVTTCDLEGADVVGDFMAAKIAGRFDVVWCSHVLEHQQNVGAFLRKCVGLLSHDGWLAVTVPPMKEEVVGGHLALFNAGTLLYNLILAGVDCSRAKVKTYGYNVSVIVQNRVAVLPRLAMDCGDIEKLAEFFPVPVRQGFDGRIGAVNWSV